MTSSVKCPCKGACHNGFTPSCSDLCRENKEVAHSIKPLIKSQPDSLNPNDPNSVAFGSVGNPDAPERMKVVDVIVVAVDKENFQTLIDRANSWAMVSKDIPEDLADDLVDALADYNIRDKVGLEMALDAIDLEKKIVE